MAIHDIPSMHALCFPYERTRPLAPDGDDLRSLGRRPGSALVWRVQPKTWLKERVLVDSRPGGMALVVILPPAADLRNDASLWEMVARSRPQAILPHQSEPELDELVAVLRKPPEDLPAAVTDYLRWRGIRLDGDTTYLVRRTLEMSGEINSVTALSRGLYLSRRALGRRFASRGLPVPSHWLQFGRVLRLSLTIQNTSSSIHSIALRHRYPDGFAASNQVYRLIGYRPSEVRDYLGWEWILEAWLRREAESGSLRPRPSSAFDDLRIPGEGARRTRPRRKATG